jgi:hypothetical protein
LFTDHDTSLHLLFSGAEELHSKVAEVLVQEATLVLPQVSVGVDDSCNSGAKSDRERANREKLS